MIRRTAPFKRIDAQSQRNSGGHPHESEDCTVRAISVAADIRYEDAHAIMNLAGRKELNAGQIHYGLHIGDELGMFRLKKIGLITHKPDIDAPHGCDEALFTRAEMLDHEAKFSQVGKCWMKGRYLYHRQPTRRVTLRMVLEKLPKGRYICCTDRHAFAVIDGIVHDATPIGLASRVHLCYQILGAV